MGNKIQRAAPGSVENPLVQAAGRAQARSAKTQEGTVPGVSSLPRVVPLTLALGGVPALKTWVWALLPGDHAQYWQGRHGAAGVWHGFPPLPRLVTHGPAIHKQFALVTLYSSMQGGMLIERTGFYISNSVPYSIRVRAEE